jgi:O-antigen/teichoic acid export membrane protein
MKSLAKWQMISFLSRGVATALGIVQGAVIFRILSQPEFGLKELALSIGGTLGIYQHLGLASASTREIAAAKDDSEVFKIFVTSVFVRYCVTLPLAVGLFFSAGYLARKYPGLDVLLKLYAVSLLFQGMQSILNAVISGTKRFKSLFLYQIIIAVVSVGLYIPLVYFFRVTGFFYAFLIFNIISTGSLAFIAFKPLKGKMVFPSVPDFRRLFKDIFSISMAIYVVKVLYTNWEKLGNNLLGIFVSAEAVAIYGFAAIIAKKLMLISDSVTTVNLPVLSEKFEHDIEDFKETFSSNFNKIFVIVLIAAVLGAFWSSQVVIVYGGFQKYLEYKESLRLVPPLIIAFVFYSFINIIQSSILVPAKLVKGMITGFLLLLGSTALAFVLTNSFMNTLYSMAWSMSLGGVLCLVYFYFIVKKSLKFVFFNHDHVLLLLQAFAICFAGFIENFWLKSLTFTVLFALLLSGIYISGLVTKEEVILVKNKLLGFLPCKNTKA